MREADERAANVVLYRTVCVAMHVDQNWDGAFGFAAGATAAPALCRLGFRLLLALTLASSASAYDYPLSTTAISETYFLGRRMAL
jgi:hypothetical protein